MRLAALVLALLFVAPSAYPQDEEGPPPLTEADGWRSAVGMRLAASQAAFSNWQEGGVNALAFNTAASGRFARVLGSIKQVHELNLEFGQLKQDTLDFRKAADLIRYALGVQYTATGVLQPTVALVARTQFAAGFDYDPTLEEYPPEDFPGLAVVPGAPLQVSAFAAPAYLTQTVGVTYDPDRWYTARLGVALKETVVTIERLRPLYGNAPDEAVRVEAGLDLAVEAQRELFENVLWQSRLGVFQAFNQVGNTAPDALFENTLTLKVNNVLNVNLDIATLFDRDVSEDVQLKEVLSVGVAFTLL